MKPFKKNRAYNDRADDFFHPPFLGFLSSLSTRARTRSATKKAPKRGGWGEIIRRRSAQPKACLALLDIKPKNFF